MCVRSQRITSKYITSQRLMYMYVTSQRLAPAWEVRIATDDGLVSFPVKN